MKPVDIISRAANVIISIALSFMFVGNLCILIWDRPLMGLVIVLDAIILLLGAIFQHLVCSWRIDKLRQDHQQQMQELRQDR